MEIRKYPFEAAGEFEMTLTRRAPVLAVQVQKGQPVMWVGFNPDRDPVVRKFRVVKTGESVEDTTVAALNYVGTVQLDDGNDEGHLFEVLPPRT